MAEMENEIQVYDVEPDVDALKDDFDRCKRNLSYYLDRAEEAKEIRRNIWAGKTGSGSKDFASAFPWPHSSDLSAQLVGPIIDQDIALLKSAVTKSNLIAAPVESGDIASASIVTNYMRWRLSSMEELNRECSVAANYMLENGIAFLGVSFKQEITRVLEPLSLEQISQNSPDLAAAIVDPQMKESALETFRAAFPTLSKKRVNKMFRELNKNGVTQIPVDKTVVSRPTVRAMELGKDIVVDSNVIDLQSARAIYTVTYLTPEQLKAKVKTDGFDADWVDNCIETTTGNYNTDYNSYSEGLLTGQNESPDHYDGLIKIITCYRREIDEDGVSMCCVTIFSEDAEGYARKYVMSVDAGAYPFVALARESLTRRLLDSRGIPELLKDFQIATKSELDQRRDAASLATCPPLEYVIGRKPEAIGAGSQIPVRRRGEVGYLTGPNPSPASMEIEQHLRNLSNKICGNPTGPDDMVQAQVLKQNLVNTWLHGWSQVLKKMWALDREYNTEVFFRVSNSALGQSVIMDDMASTYDFQLTWNSIDADQAQVLEKLKAVGEILVGFDKNGQARLSEFLKIYLDSVDPNLSARLIAPMEEASTKEVVETTLDFSKISSGMVVNAPPSANAQLRLQVIQQILTGTSEIPAQDLQEKLQSDEKFRARLETYTKQLEFKMVQDKNKLVGQLGTQPGNVPPSVAA